MEADNEPSGVGSLRERRSSRIGRAGTVGKASDGPAADCKCDCPFTPEIDASAAEEETVESCDVVESVDIKRPASDDPSCEGLAPSAIATPELRDDDEGGGSTADDNAGVEDSDGDVEEDSAASVVVVLVDDITVDMPPLLSCFFARFFSFARLFWNQTYTEGIRDTRGPHT